MIESTSISSVEPSISPTLVKAREYILALYNQQSLDQKLVFHNLKSTIRLVNFTNEIAIGEGLSAEEKNNAVLAAWFCFCGFLKDYKNPLPESRACFLAFLDSNDIPQSEYSLAFELMGLYYKQNATEGSASAVFKDAIKVLLYGPEYKVAQNLLQYEAELNSGSIQEDRLASKNQLLQGLLNAQLNTVFAIEHYGQVISQNILSTRKQVKKLDPDNGLEPINQAFDHIEEGVPNRGIQSYFRSIYRVHINLSAIADNKANIMISVNAILISVLISLLSYKNISETNPKIMFPVLVFIVTGLTSLIFAVLSARPKISYPNKGIKDRNILKRNAIFFGSYVTMELDEYESVMDEMFRDGKLIYGNMIRDMYFLGKVLDKKYQFLVISYNIFMIGFAITVLSFLLILFVY